MATETYKYFVPETKGLPNCLFSAPAEDKQKFFELTEITFVKDILFSCERTGDF